MYLLVLLIPLFSAVVSGLFGRKIGARGAEILTSGCILFLVIVSCFIYFETTLNHSPTYIKLWKWFNTELLIANFGFQFDGLTASMLVVISCVSALVHIYSIGYMAGDPHIPRFMSYLSLFTFLMIILVTSDNYIQLFIGWEGVGLCSYLLVNFWLTRIKANKAAMKAMLINRVGDMGLVLAILGVFYKFGSVEFIIIDGVVSYLKTGDSMITMVCLLLFVGAVGKSAQLGLHTWLPDAMEGPTPVSALIHAATMVTAGVFLIIRSAPLFEYSSFALTLITIMGALTAFFAATTGVVQNDLKKVIAYSTCSQLGYMVMICGIAGYSLSLFHLINHAFFKALLFLSAGSVIHAVSDEQDMRKMGALIRSIPITYVMIFIGSFSLMGFPYLTGFYSKDLILEYIFDKYYIIFVYWLGSFSALLTAFYSARLIYLTFLSSPNFMRGVGEAIEEPSKTILVPLVILAAGSIFAGYCGKEIVLNTTMPPIVPTYIKFIPLLFSLGGGSLAFCLMTLGQSGVYSQQVYQRVYTFFNSAWQFNYVINHFIVENLFIFGHIITYKLIDRGVLETLGPGGVTRVIIKWSKGLSRYQSGLIFNYALIMIIFVTLFIAGVIV